MAVNRRDLIRRLGLGAAMLPLLPSRVLGANGSYPQRLLLLVFPNGAMPSFWPTSGSTRTNYTFGDVTQALQPYRDDINVLRGLHILGGSERGGQPGHFTLTMLFSGGNRLSSDRKSAGNGPTIDQYIAERIEDPLPFRSLVLGLQPSPGGLADTRMSWASPDRPITPIFDPYEAGSLVFGRGTQVPQATNVRLLEQRGIVGSVLDEYRAVRAVASREDHESLDSHIDSLEQIQMRFSNSATAGCSTPRFTRMADPEDRMEKPALTEAFFDVVTSAFACDATRVATLLWHDSNGGYNTFYPFLGNEFIPRGRRSASGQSGDAVADHNLAHDAGVGGADHRRRKAMRDAWFVSQLKLVIEKFKSVPEGGETLLDHTLIVFATHMETGYDHRTRSIPLLTAGGACGTIRTGQYLDFGDVPHNRLLGTISSAFGHDVPTFGNDRYDATPFDELLI